MSKKEETVWMRISNEPGIFEDGECPRLTGLEETFSRYPWNRTLKTQYGATQSGTGVKSLKWSCSQQRFMFKFSEAWNSENPIFEKKKKQIGDKTQEEEEDTEMLI